MTVDMRDAVLALPVFGTLGRKRSQPTDPGQLALDAKLLYRAYGFRGVQAADCHGDAAALYPVICQRGAAGTAKVPLCDVRAHEGRRAPARPAQVVAPDTREGHEWLTGCPLAHPAMAKARVLRRREQLIPHSSALTATSPLGRVFLDYSHVVFPMLPSKIESDRFNPFTLFLRRVGTALRAFVMGARSIRLSGFSSNLPLEFATPTAFVIAAK
jgi:hypothetical protein